MSQEYEFTQRLEKLIQADLFPEELLARVKKTDLQTMIQVVLSDSTLLQQINALVPNTGLRLDKEKSGLTRTLTLLRAQNNELACIVETENLDTSDAICETEEFDGLFKKGTPAWRLDGTDGPQKYASLYVPLSKAKKFNPRNKESQKIIQALQKEIAFAWSLPKNDYVLCSMLGPIFSNEQGSFITTYSAYGIRLDDIDQHHLSQEQLYEVVSKILEGLVFLEENDVVHGDIKPSNVLVFITQDNIQVKFIDFGTVCNIQGNTYKQLLHATVGYESPEIALAMSDPSMPDHNEYEAVYQEDGKTFAKKCADELASKLKSIEAFKQPHPKNDIWAAGVMLYELLNHSKAPSSQPNEPFLHGMLAPNRSKRFNAKQALKEWKNFLAKKPQAKQPSFLPSFGEHRKTYFETILDQGKNFLHEKFDIIKTRVKLWTT